jgi:hypothetical protein
MTSPPVISSTLSFDISSWNKYNPSLVQRINVLMVTSFLNTWRDDLERENEGKVGRPYEYPEEFFLFLSKIRSLCNALQGAGSICEEAF